MIKRLSIVGLLAVCLVGVMSTSGAGVTNSYLARGIVESVTPDHRRVTIHHQAIPGYMMEMTMEFPVRKTDELADIVRGDEIAFNLLVTGEEDWVEGVKRIGHAALSPAKQAPVTRADVPELRPGDFLPDDEVLTETGRRIRFSEFQGKALAFTFFFTRCPLPDFCPRMNRNFSEARQLILSTPRAPTNWELMSLSFDPDFDTPKALAGYATLYRGDETSHWLFAASPAATLSDLAPRLDLMVMRQGSSISHNLRTVVLDPQGRVFRQFDGNQWTPRDLADAILEASRLSATPTSNPNPTNNVQQK